MPKSYSEQERELIKESLMQHGAECIATYGIRRTTVDELVKRARIPKGTFYLFYPSKEVLLFQVILRWHDKIEQDILKTISDMEKVPDAEELTNIIFNICTQLDQAGLIECLTNGDMEILMRKLPPAMIEEHLAQDDDMVEKLIAFLPQAANKDVKAYSAAFRGVFLLLLHKQEMGADYGAAIKLAIKGLFIQLLGGE